LYALRFDSAVINEYCIVLLYTAVRPEFDIN